MVRAARARRGMEPGLLAVLVAGLMAALMILALGAAPGPALAQAQTQAQVQTLAPEPGWCVQCHRLDGPEGRGLVLGQMAWRGPLAQDELSLCPGLRRARQELLAAESRLAALSALLPGLQTDRLAVAGLERGLERAVELKRQALAQPIFSLEEIGARLAREQSVLAEQVERPLRAQQGLRAAGALWGLGLMAALALVLAWLRGLRRLGRGQSAQPPLAGGEAPLQAGPGQTPLERVRRGELP